MIREQCSFVPPGMGARR